MEIFEVLNLSEDEKVFVYDLWNAEYPAKIAYNSIAEFDDYLVDLKPVAHFFIKENDRIYGWALTFNRDGELCFGITIDSSIHRKGYGRMLLDYLKLKNESLSGWAIDHDKDLRLDGLTYKSPINFYLNNGFEVFENIRMYNGRINAIKISYKAAH